MMKIGVSSYSFLQHIQKTGANYLDICALAKNMGYEGIEFTDLSLAVQPAESLEALADAIRARCASLRLPIIAYTVGAEFLLNDPSAEVERLKGCVDIAARLGAPLMRHDATRGGKEGWREAVDKIAPAIRALTEYAATKGIRTCTENHGYCIQDANRVEELILTVNHENYGWLVDIGNFACADEDSVHAVTIAAPYAFHVHAKDFLIKPAGAEDPGQGWFRSRHGAYLRGTVAGHGRIPIKACLDILRKTGYDGWLSYEFEGMEENLAALEASLAYLQSIV